MGYWIYEEDILHQMVYSQLRVNNLAEYIVLILIPHGDCKLTLNYSVHLAQSLCNLFPFSFNIKGTLICSSNEMLVNSRTLPSGFTLTCGTHNAMKFHVSWQSLLTGWSHTHTHKEPGVE